MNLLKEKVDKIIILKKAQIAEEDPLMNFDSEDPTSFLHFNPLIWSAFDELSDFF